VDRVFGSVGELLPEFLEVLIIKDSLIAPGDVVVSTSNFGWNLVVAGFTIFVLKVGSIDFVTFIGHHGEDIDCVIHDTLAILIHRQTQAAPDLLPFFISETVWLRVQIWKRLGLSQPSLSAEWAKMN